MTFGCRHKHMILVLSRQYLAMMAFGCQHKHMILVEVVLSRQHLTIMAFGCQHKHMNHDPCPLPQHKHMILVLSWQHLTMMAFGCHHKHMILVLSWQHLTVMALAVSTNIYIWSLFFACNILIIFACNILINNNHGIGCQHKHMILVLSLHYIYNSTWESQYPI